MDMKRDLEVYIPESAQINLQCINKRTGFKQTFDLNLIIKLAMYVWGSSKLRRITANFEA